MPFPTFEQEVGHLLLFFSAAGVCPQLPAGRLVFLTFTGRFFSCIPLSEHPLSLWLPRCMRDHTLISE